MKNIDIRIDKVNADLCIVVPTTVHGQLNLALYMQESEIKKWQWQCGGLVLKTFELYSVVQFLRNKGMVVHE